MWCSDFDYSVHFKSCFMVSGLFKCYLVFNISFVAFRESEMPTEATINILYCVPQGCLL